MSRKAILLGVTLLIFGCLALAADKSTFTGVVSDSHCGAKHSTAGDAATGCVKGCIKGGASYVLVTSDGKVYQLDNQDKFKDYAGQSVKVMGTANGESISVDSVEAGS
jgi:Protein of unknown function (DUF5818)